MYIPEDKRQRRWLFTINNPIFSDSGFVEENISNTNLEVIEDFYDLSVINKKDNKDLFDFKYVKRFFEKENKYKIVKRPFFKDFNCIESYVRNLDLKYIVYQYERGKKGTPHIQGFVIYRESKRFKNVKQDFVAAHITPADGTNMYNRNYCTKLDTRIKAPVEIGDFIEMRSRSDIICFFEELEKGASNIDLKGMFPTLYSQYGPDKIEKFRLDMIKERYAEQFRNVNVTYIYGETRLGKTSYIYDHYPIRDIFRVTDYGRGTFDSYRQHKVLVLDEYTGQITISYLNNLLDKYPVSLSARYSDKVACYDEVFIVSNLPLKSLYKVEQEEKPEVYNAFVARIRNIIHFTGLGQYQFEKRDGFDINNTDSIETLMSLNIGPF